MATFIKGGMGLFLPVVHVVKIWFHKCNVFYCATLRWIHMEAASTESIPPGYAGRAYKERRGGRGEEQEGIPV